MSTTTKTFGFNKPELTDAADITAMNQNWDKADDEIAKAKGTNPNLLDNWYFADPINQRAQSSYSGSGYGIDRWTMIEADGSVKLESDGITVYRQLRQYIENPNDVFGKQITASVLTSDGTLHTGTMTPANSDGGQLIVDDTTIHLYMYIVKSATSGNVSFIIECRESVTIQAVKLEFGSQQTLARQDETGKWVLNSMPPNKTLETIKCGSSTDDVNDPYANSKMLCKNLGAAPGGYGLGITCSETAVVSTLAELNALNVNRWFHYYAKTQQARINIGDVTILGAYGRVDVLSEYDARMILFISDCAPSAYRGYELIRHKTNGTWGEWEWVNPPMAEGVEYRTTERYANLPVYAKMINFGSLPSAGAKLVSFLVTSTMVIVSMYGIAQSVTSSGITSEWDLSTCDVVDDMSVVRTNGGHIRVKTNTDVQSVTAKIVVKYTKG